MQPLCLTVQGHSQPAAYMAAQQPQCILDPPQSGGDPPPFLRQLRLRICTCSSNIVAIRKADNPEWATNRRVWSVMREYG